MTSGKRYPPALGAQAAHEFASNSPT